MSINQTDKDNKNSNSKTLQLQRLSETDDFSDSESDGEVSVSESQKVTTAPFGKKSETLKVNEPEYHVIEIPTIKMSDWVEIDKKNCQSKQDN